MLLTRLLSRLVPAHSGSPDDDEFETRHVRHRGNDLRLPAPDGYALWAENYPPRPHNPLMEAEQAVVEAMLAAVSAQWAEAGRPRRALDVGTGTGRCLSLLAATGVHLVIGVDLSMPMLGHNDSGRPRICGDARRLPFPDRCFDLVCSSLMAGDVENLGAWVDEASRVLVPGGHLVYSDFHPSWNAEQWRRTFRAADGRRVEISYFPHSMEQHLASLEQAPFEVRTIREPRLRNVTRPVVVVFHAVKRHYVQPRPPRDRC